MKLQMKRCRVKSERQGATQCQESLPFKGRARVGMGSTWHSRVTNRALRNARITVVQHEL